MNWISDHGVEGNLGGLLENTSYKAFCLGKAKGPKFWTDLAPLPHFPSGSTQTTSNVAFVHLRRRYHGALPVVYRPKLMMECMLLR